MSTKTLSPAALSIIDQYLHFEFGSAICSVPYFNNKTIRARAASAVSVGKGSPQEISDEVHELTVKYHIHPEALADESLKKLLADSNIGIDCSGFVWYVLDSENQARNKGSLKKHLHFPHAGGFLGKIRTNINPAKHADVLTFADNANSRLIPVSEVTPGDIITMIGNSDSTDRVDRNHILIVHEVEYRVENDSSVPTKIRYSHASADWQDGVYGSGIKQGFIEISDPQKPLLEAIWNENDTTSEKNPTFLRAKSSKTELRRLNWL